jgi:hypothetical protein
MVGVLGNLVAAWIQQDLLKNSFTPARIGIILGLTLLGIIIGAWWTRRQAATQTTQSPTENAPPAATGLWWQDVRLLWSRFKSRGRGIGLKGIFALGSHIDIDTRDDPEDRDA